MCLGLLGPYTPKLGLMGPYTLRIPVKGSIGVCTGFYMRITVFRAYSLIGPYAPKDLLGFFKGIKALECVLGLKGVWGFEGLGCWLLWCSLGCFTGDLVSGSRV